KVKTRVHLFCAAWIGRRRREKLTSLDVKYAPSDADALTRIFNQEGCAFSYLRVELAAQAARVTLRTPPQEKRGTFSWHFRQIHWLCIRGTGHTRHGVGFHRTS